MSREPSKVTTILATFAVFGIIQFVLNRPTLLDLKQKPKWSHLNRLSILSPSKYSTKNSSGTIDWLTETTEPACSSNKSKSFKREFFLNSNSNRFANALCSMKNSNSCFNSHRFNEIKKEPEINDEFIKSYGIR